MAEPENHTLHLLREMRGDIKNLDRKVEHLDRKIDRNHAELKGVINGLAQTLAGEIAARSYAAGGVERRLADIEKRLTVLEERE